MDDEYDDLRVVKLCQKLDEELQRHSGPPPMGMLKQFLPQPEDAIYPVALRALARNELAFRLHWQIHKKTGEVSAYDYISEFRYFQTDPDAAAALVVSEISWRFKPQNGIFDQSINDLISDYLGRCPEEVVGRVRLALFNARKLVPNIPGIRFRNHLGGGGQAEVFEVVDALEVGGEKVVALKVLRADIHSVGLTRFHDEIQTIRELVEAQVRGIVPVWKHGQHGGYEYFTMPKCRGSWKVEALRPPRDSKQIAKAVRGIAETIHHVHEVSKNLITGKQTPTLHRDIKPDNILVDQDRRHLVSDWGFVRRPDRRHSGALDRPGTLGYMAPEQYRREPLSPATDVFGVGATIHYLITGAAPFDESYYDCPLEMQELAVSRLLKKPAKGTKLTGSLEWVSDDLRSVCLKCLAADPARRYATAAELAADLGRIADGLPTHARPKSFVERKLIWFNAHPKAKWTSLVLALLVVVAVVVGTVTHFNAQKQAEERAARRGPIESSLSQAEQFRRQAKAAFTADPQAKDRVLKMWDDGISAAEQADRTVTAEDADLKDRSAKLLAELVREQAADAADFTLLTRLSAVQSDLLSPSLEEPDYAVIRGELEKSLGDYLSCSGCQLDAGTSAERDKLVEQISASKVRVDLTAGIDLLAILRRKASVSNRSTWEQLLNTLNQVEKVGWRNELRSRLLNGTTATEGDKEAAEHIKELPDAPISERTGLTVAVALAFAKDDPVARKALLAALESTYADRPNDYWLNVAIALCLSGLDHENPVLVSGYYKVALSIREDPVVLNNYAAALIDSGHPEAALPPLERASKLPGAPPFVWNNLGIARVMTSTGPDDPKLQQAEEEFRKAVEFMEKRYHRSYPDALLSWSQLFLKRGKSSELKEVERLTTKVIEDKQASARVRGKAYANRASAHLRIHDLTRPISPIIPPVGVAPLWPVGTPDLTALAAHVPVLHLNAAEADAREAVTLAPNEAAGHQTLGGILSVRGDYASAVRELNTAIELNPRNPGAWHDLGIAHLRSGKLETAEAAFRQALSPPPGPSQSHFLLGKVLMMQVGRDAQLIEPKRTALLDEAARHLRIITAREPRNPEPQLQLAITLFENGELDDSRTAVQKARELYRTAAEVHPPADQQLNELERDLDQFDRIARYLKADRPDQPAHVWENMYLAAIKRHHYLTATRLLDKWVSLPNQAAALPPVYPLNVATNAALAESGQARDLKQPKGSSQAALRRSILDYGRRLGDHLCELSASGDTGRKEARRLATLWLNRPELRRFDPSVPECNVPKGERDDFSLVWPLMRSFAESPER